MELNRAHLFSAVSGVALTATGVQLKQAYDALATQPDITVTKLTIAAVSAAICIAAARKAYTLS